MKKAILLLSCLALFSQSFANDALKQLGVNNNEIEYLTLSDGKYTEFHGYKDIEIVGSAIIDMKTKKIIGFVDPKKKSDGDKYELDMTTRFLTVDPLAEKYYEISPYAYVRNNPIIRFDPNGMTDFTLNKETGEVTQIGEVNDEPDRILKTNNKGEVKYKKNGDAKVAIDDIEQGILADGQNFKSKNNIFEVGGEGQPSESGVEAFALELSEYVGKEIAGAYFSNNKTEKTSHITIGMYKNNSFKRSKDKGHVLGMKQGLSLTGFFHTHPGNGNSISNSDRTVPSNLDLDVRDDILKSNPGLKFFILTAPISYGDNYPLKIDYTTGFWKR